MSNYESHLSREWDRADYSDFSDSYLEYCEENNLVPDAGEYDEWLRDMQDERDFEAYRDDR